MQRQHDMGGQPADKIETDGPPTAPWAKLLTATVGALREHDLLCVDEVRRALEDLPKEQYDRSYFERWAEALCDLLEEKGILTEGEVRDRMTALRGSLEG